MVFSGLMAKSTAFRRRIGNPRRDLKILQYKIQGRRGQLPNAIIIGAQKAGTTTLFDMLSQSPDVVPANFKEVHFFDVNFEKGLSWYKRNFPSESGRVILEASPYYLLHPLAPKRVSTVIPDCKIIIILRDPVARAYSQYRHEVRKGYEGIESFESALRAEANRLSGSDEAIKDGSVTYDFSHQHYSYLLRGLYHFQISRWLEYFSREQIFLTTLDDLVDDTDRVMSALGSFLGVSPQTYELIRSNAGGKYPNLDGETQTFLRDYYEADLEALRREFGVGEGW